jgi:hypothetical protein
MAFPTGISNKVQQTNHTFRLIWCGNPGLSGTTQGSFPRVADAIFRVGTAKGHCTRYPGLLCLVSDMRQVARPNPQREA